MEVYESIKLQLDHVKSVEIFTREHAPYCPFVSDAKEWLEKYLPNIPVKEYDIKKNSDKWKNLFKGYPNTKTLPQLLFTMTDGSRWHVSGLIVLERSFIMPN